MLDDRHNIDNLFSDILGDYAEDVPSYTWHNIQDSLKLAKKEKQLSYLRKFAIVASLLITFSLGYVASNYDLYEKSEAFYLKTLSYKALDVYREYIGDSLAFVNEKSVNNSDSLINSEKIGNDYAYILIGEVLVFPKDIEESNRLNKKNKVGNKAINEDKPNQLLTSILLWKDESRYDDGSPICESDQSIITNWSFGAKFSPIYQVAGKASYSSSQIEGILKTDEDLDLNSRLTSEMLSAYTGGLNVNYKFSKRLSIESGVFYSTSRYLSHLHGNLTAFHSNDEIDGANNDYLLSKANRNNSTTLESVRSLDYLELPFAIRYKIIDRRFGLDLSGGMSTNFLIRNDVSNSLANYSLSYNVDPTFYNANFSLGFNYNFLKNVEFNLEPTLRYSISPSNNSLLNQYPYSFAVFAGFIYSFK